MLFYIQNIKRPAWKIQRVPPVLQHSTWNVLRVKEQFGRHSDFSQWKTPGKHYVRENSLTVVCIYRSNNSHGCSYRLFPSPVDYRSKSFDDALTFFAFPRKSAS